MFLSDINHGIGREDAGGRGRDGEREEGGREGGGRQEEGEAGVTVRREGGLKVGRANGDASPGERHGPKR